MELDIKGYLSIIAQKWWVIIVMVVLCCGSITAYDFFAAQPLYEASTKLIVNSSTRAVGPVRLDSSEISSNIMLINTYKDIIKTPAIMEKVVVSHPEFHRTTKELIDDVKVGASKDSQVMSITIRDYSLDQAVQIVNAISEVFKAEITAIMNVDNVTILSEANASDHADSVSPSLLIKNFIAFVISLIISLGIIFLREYLDDTIKSEEDVTAYLGKPTLALVAKARASEWKENSAYSKKKVGIESVQHGVNHQI
ncbi:YveK family protein [Cohnella terricola]|uniref:Lipopolysaccharide biosynthesis protein n=1 Tax=Cohnella terricola TaxID=1289167 RepID=A0A559JMP0_9BACL|nr:Wzz/FepE/Etk N-terminal domain-containing protein [Cohnella terricola]TVY01130.1 lipopolysaccharide biosynthesis protein [Cohnella terricola]